MKNLNVLKRLPVLLLALVLMVSCSDDDNGTTVINTEDLTITELAQISPNLSSLVAALLAADGDLATLLDGSTTFTVLAPTNDAFQALLDSNPSWNSLADIDTAVLQQVLLNHVITGDVRSTDLTAAGSGYAKTNADGAGGQKMSIYFNTSSGVRFNNVASVEAGGADILAKNGTIHVIDAVIGLPTLVTHATANPNFSTLAGALTSANLVDALNADDITYTVLAPDNDAFTALPAIPTGDALSNTLLNHVIDGAVLAGDLIGASSGYSNTLATGPGMNNLSIYFEADTSVTFNGMSAVTEADIVASNGIIHAVESVITLPTIVTFATSNPNFSTLVTALTDLTPATDFVSVLSSTAGDPDPFTVFAPLDAAFAAITIPTDESVLTQILQHHVVGGMNVTSGDLNNPGDTTAPSLQGDNLTVTLPGTGDNIANLTDGSGNTDIGIVMVDVQAVNGVIHVINKVALPNIP